MCFFARLEVLTAKPMKRYVFWGIIPSRPVKIDRRFGRTYCLDLQVRRANKGRKENEAGNEPVKAIISNISVNRMARLLEGNIGKHAVVGSATARG
jgi:hypothetical protein